MQQTSEILLSFGMPASDNYTATHSLFRSYLIRSRHSKAGGTEWIKRQCAKRSDGRHLPWPRSRPSLSSSLLFGSGWRIESNANKDNPSQWCYVWNLAAHVIKFTVWSFSIGIVACHFVFNRVRIGRNFPLTITKKPHAYEKNTLHLPNAVGELPGKPHASCDRGSKACCKLQCLVLALAWATCCCSLWLIRARWALVPGTTLTSWPTALAISLQCDYSNKVFCHME